MQIVLPYNTIARGYLLTFNITPGAGTNITSVMATIYTNSTTQTITNINSSIVVQMPSTSNSFVEVS